MIKKIKRYIYGLTYKESMKILIGICIIMTILITEFVTNTSTFARMVHYDIFLALLYILSIIGASFSVIILPLYFGIIFNKKLIKQDIEATSILKNAAKSSNDKIFEVIPYRNNDFIMEVINFYREQKNIYNYEEKEIRFWIQLEESIEDAVGYMKVNLYISDKDNPNKKILFPLNSPRPYYILKNFKIK